MNRLLCRTRRWGPLAAVVAAGLAAHAIVLATDYVIWDGWWFQLDLGLPGSPVVRRQLEEAGRPLELLFLAPFRWITSFETRVAAAKWASLGCWITTATLMLVFLRETRSLSDRSCLGVAILAATSPVYELMGEISLWLYTACTCLFWMAWVLLLQSRRRQGPAQHLMETASLALFFLSFNLNSLLVLFYGVAAFVAFAPCGGSQRCWRDRLASLSRRYPHFLAVPIVFWVWKSVFTPTSGFYLNYNRPTLDPSKYAAGYLGVMSKFVLPEMLEFGEAFWSNVGLIGPGLAAAFLAVLAWRHDMPEGDTEAEADAGMCVLWGTLLFALAAFPYIAVGQPLESFGWGVKNCVLCPLPLAMIVVGFLSLTTRFLPPAWRLIGFMAWLLLVVVSIVESNRNYIRLQGFGAKQESIRLKIHATVGDTHPSVVQFRDYFPLDRTFRDYPSVIWTFLAAPRNRLPEVFVLDTRIYAADLVQRDPQGREEVVVPRLPLSRANLQQLLMETKMPYALNGVPANGGQFLLAIMPGSEGSDGVVLGLKSLWHKWIAPDKKADFLNRVTDHRTVDAGRISD